MPDFNRAWEFWAILGGAALLSAFYGFWLGALVMIKFDKRIAMSVVSEAERIAKESAR